MQEKETTTKNPIRNSLTKIPCRWSCERESTRKRECRKGLLSQTHTHTHVAGLPLTHMLIMCTQREQQQQEEPQQTYKYKYKYKCRTTTKLTTRLATGTGRWEQGGSASRKLVGSRWRCCCRCLGRRRRPLAALCSTPVQISFKFWQIKPWFCYLRASERESKCESASYEYWVECGVRWLGVRWTRIPMPIIHTRNRRVAGLALFASLSLSLSTYDSFVLRAQQ